MNKLHKYGLNQQVAMCGCEWPISSPQASYASKACLTCPCTNFVYHPGIIRRIGTSTVIMSLSTGSETIRDRLLYIRKSSTSLSHSRSGCEKKMTNTVMNMEWME